jgi:outer membrane translocation and assembly module TamA
LKGYRQIALEVAFPELFRGRLELGGDVRFRWLPQEDYYGLGFATVNEDRTNYSLTGSDYSGVAAVRPFPWLATGVRLGYLHTTVEEGTDARFPSIEEVFTDAEAPGLAAQPDYLYRELFADLDTRDERGNPRSGGYYRAAWTRYSDRDLDHFNFSRFTAEASQFFPLFDKKRVFLVRGRLTITDPDDGNVVPFYLLPTLGGSHTLRSVNDFRFRDNDLLFFNVEYRWEAFSNLDMALFFDAGKVASIQDDIDFGGMKRAYGLGFRFNTHSDILYRIDIAHGDEGFKFFFKFSGPFKDRAHWPTDTRALKRRQ